MPSATNEITRKSPPLNRAIISDILLWVFLTLLIAYGVYLFAIVIPAKRGQTIVLPFKDANEISKGSAVRMMGTEVGFVDDIRIRQDHVEIVVQTYPKSLKIPSGSVFTILFTGLAGSKSIEVQLPETPQPQQNGIPEYLIEQPIRMKDTLNSSIDVTQALQKGAENIADFFGKKKSVEELQFNIHQAQEMASGAVGHITVLNGSLKELRQEVALNANQASETLSNFNEGVEAFLPYTEPDWVRSKIRRSIRFIQQVQSELGLEVSQTENVLNLNQQLARINLLNQQANTKIEQWKPHAAGVSSQHFLSGVENAQKGFSALVQKLNGIFSQNALAVLKQARLSVQRFNSQLLLIQENIFGKAKPKQ